MPVLVDDDDDVDQQPFDDFQESVFAEPNIIFVVHQTNSPCSIHTNNTPSLVGLHTPLNILEERDRSPRNGHVAESKCRSFGITNLSAVLFFRISRR